MYFEGMNSKSFSLLGLAFCLLLGFVLANQGQALAQSLQHKLYFAKAHEQISLALQLKIPEGYHAYSNETVETGRPTVFELSVSKEQAKVYYPKGAAQRDLYSPLESVFVYEGETWLFANLPASVSGQKYHASLSLLLCSKRNCLPINQEFSGLIPTNLPPLQEQSWEANYLQTVEKVQPSPQFLGELTKIKEPSPLPPPNSFAVRLTPQYAASVLEITSFSRAILFGLLAGLILNFMPCVLPVLTFKLSGMLVIGSLDQKKRIQSFRTHNLCFAAGIITFFSLLAGILGLADMIWGQLFQSETLILLMLVFVFLMGLSLLEVFSLPVIDLRAQDKAKNPHLQIFLTGFLTTFLATPCSGPLLGGVLGWAFTQPFIILMLIFWSIGLGMALPYLLFCLWPNAVLLLPKPGRWMNILEHVAGFFLIGDDW